MNRMFQQAIAFEGRGLGLWDTGRVIGMEEM